MSKLFLPAKTTMNLWFQGGGFASIWSFGVAEEIKRLGIKTDFVGGYSAGAAVAMYVINQEELHDEVRSICLNNKFSPYRGKFCMLGNAHILMKDLFERTIGNIHDFNVASYNKKLWVPVRGLKSLRGSWRNSWRDYDDLLETGIAATCIPGIHGEFPTCYYDDVGQRRGPTIDGGAFSFTHPKVWDKKNTVIVSPWGTGTLNMTPTAKISDLAFPKLENLKIHFNLGIEQAREYFS